MSNILLILSEVSGLCTWPYEFCQHIQTRFIWEETVAGLGLPLPVVFVYDYYEIILNKKINKKMLIKNAILTAKTIHLLSVTQRISSCSLT